MTDLAALVAELRAPATDIAERNDLRARAADVIEGMRKARKMLLAQIDRLFDETEREYILDVSAIDVRMSYQTRPRYRTLAEMRRAIAALALPDSKPEP